MHAELQSLLQRRLETIADRAFYERDPAAHLNALKEVSVAIESYAKTHHSEFDPKLRHYLTQSSYQKALDHLSAKPSSLKFKI